MSDARAQVEERRARRLALLHALYEWSDANPSIVFNNFWDIGAELGISRDEIWDVASYLWQEGLAERPDMSGGIAITDAGVKEVEAALSAPAQPTARFPAARNVIRIERAVNAVIQQGNVRSTQTVHLDAAMDREAAALADAVADALDRLGAADAERDELRVQVEALRAQLGSPKPRLGPVREAAVAIKEVLDGIGRAGRAAGDALPLLERAKTLLGRLRP